MGLWSFYFFAKLYLYAAGYIGLHVMLNLGLAGLVAWPLTSVWTRRVRLMLALPLGIALLYYDSWLPPLSRLFATAGDLADFSLVYLVELVGRFVNPRLVLTLVVMLGAWWLLAQRLRVATFAVLGLVLAGLAELLGQIQWPAAAPAASTAAAASGAPVAAAPATPERLETVLQAFHRSEAQRKVAFSPIPAQSSPFDVVVIHICSLAWDDVDYVDARAHPFLSRFDVRFDNFSTGASYSGPGAIRLLRGACGQGTHESLYKQAAPECLLFGRLQALGYTPQVLMNHDGHFGNFVEDLSVRGGVQSPPIDNRWAPVAMHAFDGSPVYDDYALLARWWERRLQDLAPRAALYYNTTSLHDGNRIVGRSGLSAKESYRLRLDGLFGALERFAAKLRESDRHVVLVLVPEHGANVRGDRMQISGLREIPSPSIALGPVGVRLIGAAHEPPGRPTVLDQPSSYLALSTLLSRFLAWDPFVDAASLGPAAAGLPPTEFVAENEGMVVMRYGGAYYLRSPGGDWAEYRQ